MSNEIPSVDEDQHRRSSIKSFAASLTPVSLRNASTSLPDIYVKEKENKTILRARFAWSFAKVAIFVICTAAVIYQTVNFFKRFQAFQTRININKTSLYGQEFTLPAATVCYESFSRTKFCEMYPWYCREPEDKATFCENYPHFCSVNTTDVLMPFFGENKYEIELMAFDLLKSNYNYSLPFLHIDKEGVLKSTFIPSRLNRFAKCYSSNLHLQDNEEASVYNSDVNQYELYRFQLHLNLGEKFYDPLEEPTVFFALHSPYEPTQPFYEGEIFEPGYHYFVQIGRLEEDYLLPPPYETQCVDYMEEWRKNNKTGPRSQSVCMEMCRSIHFEKCAGCEFGYLMTGNLKNMCGISEYYKCLNDDEKVENVNRETLRCKTKCRSECVKLRYRYKVEKIPTKTRNRIKEVNGSCTYVYNPQTPDPDYNPQTPDVSDGYEYFENIDITVSFINAERFQLTHSPLYTVEDAFSYIGGLMGCWLGISVWSFTSFFQRCFRRTFQWRRKFFAQHNEHNL